MKAFLNSYIILASAGVGITVVLTIVVGIVLLIDDKLK